MKVIFLIVFITTFAGCVRTHVHDDNCAQEWRFLLEEPDNYDFFSLVIDSKLVPPEAFAISMIELHGNASDIPLVSRYLDSEDPITRRYAKNCLETLKAR